MLSLYSKEIQNLIRSNLHSFLKERLLKSRLWCIVEPIRDQETAYFISQNEETMQALFGTLIEEVKEKGAYLFCLNDIPESIDWIVSHWGKNWFSFFESFAPREDIFRHFESLCMLRNRDKAYIFRFYDPVTLNAWFFALMEEQRVMEAFAICSAIYTETPLPDTLMHYEIGAIPQKTARSLKVRIEIPSKKSHQADYTPLSVPYWRMDDREYAFLKIVPLHALRIKLCKQMVKEHALLEKYTLSEVYRIINTEIDRAAKYHIFSKHLLAHFVNIRFEYESFWENNRQLIEQTLENVQMSETDRVEMLLEMVSKEENQT